MGGKRPRRSRGIPRKTNSTDTPSEAGVVLDTRAAWDWLRGRGAAPMSVLAVRSNLGTGVAVQFASALEVEADAGDKQTKSGVAGWVHPAPCGPRETAWRVLLSPFSKLETLLDTRQKRFYQGVMIRRFDSLAKSCMSSLMWVSRGIRPVSFDATGTQYRMLTYGLLVSLQSLKAPLLIVYGEDDLDIPVWHAQMLFDAFLEKPLPALPEITPKMTAVMVRPGKAAGAGAHARDGARRAREGFLEGPGGRRGRVLAYVVGRARHRAREGVQDFMAET
ncbi:hypothetical protein EDB83DRAFT_2556399 [Lactarius deliciosus]|nr:hypothetical protein EDB83DRAFT_2556399 [Lactarius deliciosus]